MQLLIDVGLVVGLPPKEQAMLANLFEIYQSHYAKNWEKENTTKETSRCLMSIWVLRSRRA